MSGYCHLLLFAVSAVTLLNFGEVDANDKIEATQNKTRWTDEKLRSLADDILQGGAVPLNLVLIGGTQYYLGDTPALDFHEATIICNALGMTLVELNSITKTDMLTGHLLLNGLGSRRWWTSGVRVLNHDRSWLWSSTGQAFTRVRWFGSNPDEFRDPQVCAYVSGNDRGIGDAVCRLWQSWICELQ